jgi:hypothetical protein
MVAQRPNFRWSNSLTTPSGHPDLETRILGRLVAFACHRPRLVTGLGVLLGAVAVAFFIARFSMTTDTNHLISRYLPWRQREAAFNRLFQPQGAQIVVVVEAVTPELADQAAAAIAARLQGRTDLFHAVERPDDGPFFAREGLLYAPLGEVRSTLDQLIAAQPFLGPLAADPSLRGLAATLSTVAKGAASGQASLAEVDRPIRALADALDQLRAGRPALFSWRTMISGNRPDPRELRRYVLATPTLDYNNLEAGARPTQFIRTTASRLGFDPAHGVRVRLTGPTPLEDEELASLSDRAGLIATIALAAILAMLWLAVRSRRLILAILVTMVIGLVVAGANGLLIFRKFNVISVAFIPLFVGLGIDFGIQFSVRYRTEHDAGADVGDALIATGRGMGRSLTLAATAIACGFLSCAPTAYVGLSQLGVIAGLGMFIALGLNLTLLPALVTLMSPPRRPPFEDAVRLERLDSLVLAHRRGILVTAAVAALASAALLPWLRFDFNPIHLKNAHSESVATLLDLSRDPAQSLDTIEIVSPSLTAADLLAVRLKALPQVSEARTLSSFEPSDQPAKLAAIADAANLLDLTLDPLVVAPPPTDAEVVASLRQTAADLRAASGAAPGGAFPDALRLASGLDWLAAARPAARARAAGALMAPLATVLDQTRAMLAAQPVSLATLPPELRTSWIAPDGKARVSVLPRGDPNNNNVLTAFIKAVAKVAPSATGAPIDVREGGRTVAAAFVEAGVLSFVAITTLLFLVLRRVRYVAITMAPIVLTGLLTMASCVLIGQPLNFANIIALPLLFGIGVAFHIYFVMAWRSGGTHLLQSSLTRAIFFSALATATGFGSLWASSHPGTASMGKLLMISLIWTLVSALIFQPALMGPPPGERA